MRSVTYHKVLPAILFGLTILSTIISRRIESAYSLELARIGGAVLFFFWPGYFLIRLLHWRRIKMSRLYANMLLGGTLLIVGVSFNP